MIELKGLSQDVLKNSSDNDNYNREFKNLQVQLFEMGNLTFNGVSMFANHTSEDPTELAIFNDMAQDLALDNTMSIYVSSDGTSGPTVSLNKALLLSALSVDSANLGTGITHTAGSSRTGTSITFAASIYSNGIELGDISVGVFTQALENLATLRADNGGTMSRLQYASDNATMQAKNFAAANGRIVDVDIAAESTNLAKYQILSQASASMIAQANSSMDIALMLLR
jgi:flagellin